MKSQIPSYRVQNCTISDVISDRKKLYEIKSNNKVHNIYEFYSQ